MKKLMMLAGLALLLGMGTGCATCGYVSYDYYYPYYSAPLLYYPPGYYYAAPWCW